MAGLDCGVIRVGDVLVFVLFEEIWEGLYARADGVEHMVHGSDAGGLGHELGRGVGSEGVLGRFSEEMGGGEVAEDAA